LKQFAISIAMLFGVQASFASLILQSPIQANGTGLGTEPTILTIQGTGNATSETGCVGLDSTGAVATGVFFDVNGRCTTGTNDTKTGAGQIGPQTLSAGGVTSASNFAIVFNADQSAAGPITLTGLQATFYSPTGTKLYTTSGFSCAGLASSPGCTFPTTNSGIGKSGYVFVLDSAQANAATLAGAFNNPLNIVGVSGSATTVNGGAETFYLANTTGTAPGPSPTPEPGTWFSMVMGLGLVGLATLRRRSRG